METDRERLRTVYNWDFKIRYGPAQSPAQIRGPSSPPRPLAAGPPFPPRGAEGRSSPSGASRSRGGADLPSRAVPTPRQRRPEPARSARPGPCAQSRRRTARAPRAPRRPGPGGERGPAPTRRSRGRGMGGARPGGGERERGPRHRGTAGGSCLRLAAGPGAGSAGTPAPPPRGCLPRGSAIPGSRGDPVWEGESPAARQRRKGLKLYTHQTSISTCGFSMETQGQPPGGLSHPVAAGCLGPPVAIEVKTRRFVLADHRIVLQKHLSTGCSLGPEHSLTGINVKTYTNTCGVVGISAS